MAEIQMTDDRFEEVVLKSEVPVMVDFGGEWCGPCKRLEPIMERISDEYAGKIIVVKCDVAICEETVKQFGIFAIPTVLFFKDGKLVDRHTNYAPEEVFVQKIEKLF